jgi:Amino acid synthesis
MLRQEDTAAYRPNCAGMHVRKWYRLEEEILANESGMAADGEPLIRMLVAATIRNPFAGQFSRDLSQAVHQSVALGAEFGRRLLELTRGRAIESYGKGCIVGINGEYEHGNAFLTTEFADPLRLAVGGAKAWIPSTGKRGGPGTSIDVPLAHKDALYVRSHYDTVTVSFGDAPGPDEVIVIFACATRGRLHARLGGLNAAAIVGLDGLR